MKRTHSANPMRSRPGASASPAVVPIAMALLPLAVMGWVVAETGFGIA